MVLFSPPFREISTFTRPGARWNEDAVGGGGSFLYVLDGATSLDAAPVMDPVSDAAWLVRETARWLDRHLPEASRPLEDILAQGMARLLDQWSGPRAALPSAGVAIFRRRGEGVEYFGLGDCAASLQLTDGTFRTWEETALSALDGQALEEACALAQARGCSLRESLPGIQATLRRHRALRNTPGGYWILDPTGVGIPHARRETVPLSQCRSLFLCTDGLAQCVGFGLAADGADLHRRAAEGGWPPWPIGFGPARRPTQTWRPCPVSSAGTTPPGPSARWGDGLGTGTTVHWKSEARAIWHGPRFLLCCYGAAGVRRPAGPPAGRG